MINFEYHQPLSLDEAILLLTEYGSAAKVLAGGTDLLIRMKRGEISPPHIISLKNISELNFIQYENEAGLCIGAATTLSTLASSQILKDKCPVLVDSIETIASPQIQNMATIGGNLCNASPSADTAPPLIALNAEVKIIGPNGEKHFPVEDYFVGPKETILETGEILVEIRIPKMAEFTKAVYLKHGVRKAMEIAIVGVAIALDIDPDEFICHRARIVMGAVAPIPLRSLSAESILIGHIINKDLIEKAADAATNDANPISDIRASKKYRLEILKVLIERGISEALQKSHKETCGK